MYSFLFCTLSHTLLIYSRPHTKGDKQAQDANRNDLRIKGWSCDDRRDEGGGGDDCSVLSGPHFLRDGRETLSVFGPHSLDVRKFRRLHLDHVLHVHIR